MVSHEKIREVLKNWNLENETITNVHECVCYVGEEYVIKFSTDLSSVENNISVSQAIEREGLSTATPIMTTAGEYVAKYEDMYFYVMKRLEGNTLDVESLYREDYTSKARLLGKSIGQLSVALSKINVIANQPNIYASAIEWAIPTLEKKMDLPKSFIEMYEKEFGKIYESLSQQIIHRDPNPGNFIFSSDKWGVLDFDLSERNLRIFDPCYAATAILSESFEVDNTDKLNQWKEIYKSILLGYDEVAKLSEDEWKAIPYVAITNQLISTAWFSEQEMYKDLYEKNKKMTEWMLQDFDVKE